MQHYEGKGDVVHSVASYGGEHGAMRQLLTDPRVTDDFVLYRRSSEGRQEVELYVTHASTFLSRPPEGVPWHNTMYKREMLARGTLSEVVRLERLALNLRLKEGEKDAE